MPSMVSAQRLSGAAVTSAPHTAWSNPGTNWPRASSEACPPGPWPQSWPRAMASTRATLSRQARAMARGHLGHLEGMGQAGALVIGGKDEHLGLAGQAAERGRVQDPVPVALEAGAPRIGLLGTGSKSGAHRPGGAGGQRLGLGSLAGRRDRAARTARPPRASPPAWACGGPRPPAGRPWWPPTGPLGGRVSGPARVGTRIAGRPDCILDATAAP